MPKNRFDKAELAGAFGDLGTLAPFVIAYVTVLKMDPCGILLGFGVAQIVAGVYYRTPFPVQPMKAIGAIAITQAAQGSLLTPGAVVSASVATGLIWLALGVSGLAQKLSAWTPRSVTLGIMIGLGVSFMLQSLRFMAADWLVAGLLLAVTAWLLTRSRPPAMFVLLAAGPALALLQQPGLLHELAAIRGSFHLPALSYSLSGRDIWLGLVLLTLPQLPLTLGNACVAVVAENNRLFPDRPVSERQVAVSTGLLNLWSGAVGGAPMCHGAGGLAGHVRFGAHTGGAPIIIGMTLTVLALFFSESAPLWLRLFPPPALGVILFFAGWQLALTGYGERLTTVEKAVALITATVAVWHAGFALLAGWLLRWGFKFTKK